MPVAGSASPRGQSWKAEPSSARSDIWPSPGHWRSARAGKWPEPSYPRLSSFVANRRKAVLTLSLLAHLAEPPFRFERTRFLRRPDDGWSCEGLGNGSAGVNDSQLVALTAVLSLLPQKRSCSNLG